MTAYYLIAFLAVVLTAVCQIMMKIGSSRAHGGSPLRTIFNPLNLCAYVILLVVTVMTTYAFKYIPMKMNVVLLPFTYIFVGAFSHLFLAERLTRKQLAGAALILLGVIVFGL